MISFEELEKDYLIQLLNKQPENWIRDQVVLKIEYDDDRIETIRKCNHTFSKYLGQKECCSKCGAFDVGMGEKWEVLHEIED